MRRYGLIAALAVALGAGPAIAQSVFRTPTPNVNAPGEVAMCGTTGSSYVPCSAPGALPIPVTVQNTPQVIVSQPAQVRTAVAVATGTTGAVTATMTTTTGTLYLCGFDVSAIGGTATVGPITVTGLAGGTFTYQLASTAAGNVLFHPFTPCLPASAPTTSIAVATTADGTATAVDVNVWGIVQ